MKSSRKIAGLGLVTALASSLCCIAPLLTIVAGSSSLASGFSWLAPARPFLIGLTALVLGYAWYAQLKPTPVDDCGCEPIAKKSFLKGKTFLSIVTVFTIGMTAFPYYSSVFYPEKTANKWTIEEGNLAKLSASVEGMTCEACENHVNQAVQQVSGVASVTTSYNKGATVVQYDQSKTSQAEITQAIESTGYTIKEIRP